MANTTVSIILRFKQADGRVRNLTPVYSGKSRLKPGWAILDGKEQYVGGDYYLRWYKPNGQVWKKIGPDANVALLAQIRQERVLAGESVPSEQSSQVSRVTLLEVITAFLEERESSQDYEERNESRRKLYLFADVCGKQYWDEIQAEDTVKFVAHLKTIKSAKGKPYSERTIHNFMRDLQTFFKAGGKDIIKKLPRYAEKIVDRYTDEELDKFFAACDAEEHIRYQFFLYTGCREQEVMYMNPDTDIDTVKGTVTVREKAGFTVKNRKERVIPIPDCLVEEIKTYKVLYPGRKFLFINRDGRPDGHMLRKLKLIAKRGGLAGNWTLHRFRRTFATRALENGVPIHVVKEWLGHSDFTTLLRYVAELEATGNRARELANKMVLA